MRGDPNLVLDVYGNNAAVRCPSCGNVFIFSEFQNKKSGRICPHCQVLKAVLVEGTLKTVETHPASD